VDRHESPSAVPPSRPLSPGPLRHGLTFGETAATTGDFVNRRLVFPDRNPVTLAWSNIRRSSRPVRIRNRTSAQGASRRKPPPQRATGYLRALALAAGRRWRTRLGDGESPSGNTLLARAALIPWPDDSPRKPGSRRGRALSSRVSLALAKGTSRGRRRDVQIAWAQALLANRSASRPRPAAGRRSVGAGWLGKTAPADRR